MRKALFLCIGNSCRSQMAEGWLRHLAGDRFEAHSAGVYPCFVHPDAIAVMDEVGIDISHQRSKHVDEFTGQPFDFIITVCDPAQTACPVVPGVSKKEHWPIDDPVDGSVEVFRRVRDEIGDRMRKFVAQNA